MKIRNDLELADYLEKKVIDDGYSPAAALASIKPEGTEFSTTIGVSAFYSYITKGVFRFLTNADLPEKPKRKRTYKRVKVMNVRHGKICGGRKNPLPGPVQLVCRGVGIFLTPGDGYSGSGSE